MANDELKMHFDAFELSLRDARDEHMLIRMIARSLEVDPSDVFPQDTFWSLPDEQWPEKLVLDIMHTDGSFAIYVRGMATFYLSTEALFRLAGCMTENMQTDVLLGCYANESDEGPLPMLLFRPDGSIMKAWDSSSNGNNAIDLAGYLVPSSFVR